MYYQNYRLLALPSILLHQGVSHRNASTYRCIVTPLISRRIESPLQCFGLDIYQYHEECSWRVLFKKTALFVALSDWPAIGGIGFCPGGTRAGGGGGSRLAARLSRAVGSGQASQALA